LHTYIDPAAYYIVEKGFCNFDERRAATTHFRKAWKRLIEAIISIIVTISEY